MTELLYLRDTYLFTSEAKIIEVWENEFWKYLILDKTIFYPQWWGQPSDTGNISTADGKMFSVEKVKLSPEGKVYHFWSSQDVFSSNETVFLQIDSKKRLFNARNHSAGHLVDVAMKHIWCSYMKPTKGYHFPEGGYVEYEWDFQENMESFISQLSQELKQLVEQDKKIAVVYEDIPWVISPRGKEPRYVYFEGEDGCGCWGTHVGSTKEIGSIMMRKAKFSSGVLKVSYQIQAEI